jgi:hypothetical protein
MKYVVRCAIPVFLSITVEAEHEEAAIDVAMDSAYLGGFVGNGGTDKLVGTTEENVSLDVGEEVLDDEPFKIWVEKAQ